MIRPYLALLPLLVVQVPASATINDVFSQERATFYTREKGLEREPLYGWNTDDVRSIVVTDQSEVVAGILTGPTVEEGKNLEFLQFTGEGFAFRSPFGEHVTKSRYHEHAAVATGATFFSDKGRSITQALFPDRGRLLATEEGVWQCRLKSPDERAFAFTPGSPVLSLAAGPGGAAAIGAEDGLYLRSDTDAEFEKVYPTDGKHSWAPRSVSALAYDSRGRLWFGSRQGVGVLDGENWVLYTGDEGLPYNRFTCAAPGEDGVIWFGTEHGAIRFDGERWAYRAADRWLPDDRVNSIAVQEDGTAWIATPKGISRIQRLEMTLEKKADHFVDQVESRHNRDGYITDWVLERRGDVTSAVPKITDNDGMYTAMYGAAMSFRYADTKDPEDKRIADRCFQACKRLVDIVPESMKGFPARVIIPIDWHEPVNEQYGDEYNRKRRRTDPFWKLITPRFVTSEDGKYLWKNDTSSDELTGHYFLYAVYYDLVAETEEEKEQVREVVREITDHLIRNGFNLVDHDGKPTRWGRFGPDFLHSVYGWEQRGLNSLMMLGCLAAAEHITGDEKYAETAGMLRERHNYHINVMEPRPFFPPENVVPWDNNLGLMCAYPLMLHEKDPELLLMYRLSLEHFWLFISKQKNPFWSFLYGACAQRFADLAGRGYFDGAFPEAGPYASFFTNNLTDYDPAISDSLDTLRGLPIDLIAWEMKNSHRLDIQFDPTPSQEPAYGWSRLDGKALPIEERGHVRQDRDGFFLDYCEGGEGSGFSEHEGTFYLLPYYMGRYHGFIQ